VACSAGFAPDDVPDSKLMVAFLCCLSCNFLFNGNFAVLLFISKFMLKAIAIIKLFSLYYLSLLILHQS
jgi:hypothetical protein